MHRPGDLGREKGRLASPAVDQPDGDGEGDANGQSNDASKKELTGRDPASEPGEDREDEQEAAGLGRARLHGVGPVP